MPSTHKKVIVRKMDRDSVSGYVSPSQFVNEGKLEVLNTSGTVIAIDLTRDQGRLFCARVWRLGVADAEDVYFASAVGGVVGAAAIQGQRDSRRADARRPDADHAGGISGESSGPAVEHAANFCAADGAGVADGAGGDWRDAPAAAAAEDQRQVPMFEE